MLRAQYWCSVFLFFAAYGTAISAQAQVSLPACQLVEPGYIVNLRGSDKDYQIIRGGQRIEPDIFSELVGGDQIRLLRDGTELVIRTLNGTTYTISFQSRQYCVRREAPPSLISNVLRRIGELASLRRAGRGGDLTAQGDESLELAPFDLVVGSAQVAAGSRYLALAWMGGIPPFTVEVTDQGGGKLVSERGLHTRLLRLSAPRTLRPDEKYQVVVRDAERSMATGTFLTVAPRPVGTGGSPDAALAVAVGLLNRAQLFDTLLLLSPYRHMDPTVDAVMDSIIEVPADRQPTPRQRAR